MERFKEGQKVRVLTMEEILKEGYFLDGDGDIYVGEDDEFFVKSMCDYCNVEHEITASEDKKQQFTIEGFRFTPGMCEEIKGVRGFKVVSDEFKKHPNANIKLPFVVEGLFLGFLGSLIPIIASVYGYNALYNYMSINSISPFLKLVPPTPFIFMISLILLLIGILVGMFGSAGSVRKYLKI